VCEFEFDDDILDLFWTEWIAVYGSKGVSKVDKASNFWESRN